MARTEAPRPDSPTPTRRAAETDQAFAARVRQYDDQAAPIRAMLALDAGGMASWEWRIDTGAVYGDACWAETFGVEDGRVAQIDVVMESIHPDDRDAVNGEIEDAVQRGEEYEVEFRVRDEGAPGGWRWLGGRGRVTERGPNGEAVAMLGVNWDLSEQKTQEENLRLLAAEMDHRVKNAFAVMRALINLGRRTANDLDSFATDLAAQVQAMADAHAVSARLARRELEPRPEVPIHEVVLTALAPWLNDQSATRVKVDLDERVCIETAKVSALAMLLYELVTNAAKHGALREAPGELRVTVSMAGREAVLRWVETLNAQPRRAPQRGRDAKTSGFGSVLIQHCTGMLGAEVTRDLRPEGLLLELRMPFTACPA